MTHDETNVETRAVESDFDAFRESGRPASQIEALPPGSTGQRWHARSKSSTGQAQEQGRGMGDTDDDDGDDESTSAVWSPEEQTLQAVRQMQHHSAQFGRAGSASASTGPSQLSSATTSCFEAAWRSSTAPTSAHSSPAPRRGRHSDRNGQAGAGSKYDFPSEDDAMSISYSSSRITTRDPSLGPAASRDRDGNGNGSGKHSTTSSSAAHPLTYEPSVNSAWDFDRLFSRRRRWSAGQRIVDDDPVEGHHASDADADADADIEDSSAETEIRRTGRLRHKVVRRTRKKSTLSKEVVVDSAKTGFRDAAPTADAHMGDIDAERARQLEVYEAMRQGAMQRLALLSSHLNWDPSSASHTK